MVETLRLKLKEQKGFTLIELLAVIVILGIIAAIAIPAIGNVISKSTDKAKVQEGLQIINAAKLYATDTELVFTNDVATLTPTLLNKNLDHVKDDTFNVIVTKEKDNSTPAKYTGKLLYSIQDHDSVKVIDSAAKETKAADGTNAAVIGTTVDEQQLVNYTK